MKSNYHLTESAKAIRLVNILIGAALLSGFLCGVGLVIYLVNRDL